LTFLGAEVSNVVRNSAKALPIYCGERIDDFGHPPGRSTFAETNAAL
jgi:hypothetical protein